MKHEPGPDQHAYTFTIEATISLSIEVFAGSMKEAIEKAQSADLMRINSMANGDYPGEWSTSELDCGEPSHCQLVGASANGVLLNQLEVDCLKWGREVP